jgi:hypothetical protein
MSFDLFFYKQKDRDLSQAQIAKYLGENLTVPNEKGTEWFFNNEDTGVYYAIGIEDRTNPDDIDTYESFVDFDNTKFTFNVNYLRPNFFGFESLSFVDRFITDLDLYVLNPQSTVDSENPQKETFDSLYSDWLRPNLQFGSEKFDELKLLYYPEERSSALWEYDFYRSEMQERLGDEYFVSGSFYVGEPGTRRAYTLTTWTQHIPCVLPPADYVALIRKRKKLFRTIDETGVVSYDALMSRLGRFFKDHEHHGKVIHPAEAGLAADDYNSIPFEMTLSDV